MGQCLHFMHFFLCLNLVHTVLPESACQIALMRDVCACTLGLLFCLGDESTICWYTALVANAPLRTL